MQKLEFSLKFEEIKEEENGYPVIVVAAGSSSRMMGIDKQFASVSGIPVIARTLCRLEKSRYITEITVVTRKEKIADIGKLAEKYAITKLKNIVEGGNSREASVKNGLLLYKNTAEKVLIHDGARPLVDLQTIENVALALRKCDSVTCAVKVKDTIKRIDESGIVKETLNRSELVSIQTPQGVSVSKFLSASEKTDLASFTDDTSVIEYMGERTRIVDGNYENIKITTPQDIALAEAYIAKE